jgi:hypothetical protein
VPPVGQQYGQAYTQAQLETERVKCNNQVKANWKTWGATGLVEFAADSRLATPSNHTYFSNADGLELHFTTAGNTVMAELVDAAIPAVVAGGFYGTVTQL